MRMMRIHGVWTRTSWRSCSASGMYSSFMLIPQYVQEPTSTGYGFGASVTQAGLFLCRRPSAMSSSDSSGAGCEHRRLALPLLVGPLVRARRSRC